MSLQLNRFGKILGKSAKPSEFYAKPPLNYTNFLKSEALRPALDDNTPNQPGDALDAGGPGRYNRLDMPRPMGSAYAFRETLAKRRGRMDGPHRIDRTARIIAAQNRRQRATSMPRGRRHRATLRPALDDDTPRQRDRVRNLLLAGHRGFRIYRRMGENQRNPFSATPRETLCAMLAFLRPRLRYFPGEIWNAIPESRIPPSQPPNPDKVLTQF